MQRKKRGEPEAQEQPLLPKKEAGLPHTLKAEVERFAGFRLDNVQVHYNSPRPAEIQAQAYTQGTQIYLGPNQKHHLAHETWHVVQQKQRRVRPTLQTGGVAINNDAGLEAEADVVASVINAKLSDQGSAPSTPPEYPVQEKSSFASPAEQPTAETPPPIQGFFILQSSDAPESKKRVFTKYNYFKIKNVPKIKKSLNAKRYQGKRKEIISLLESWAQEHEDRGSMTGAKWVEKALASLESTQEDRPQKKLKRDESSVPPPRQREKGEGELEVVGTKEEDIPAVSASHPEKMEEGPEAVGTKEEDIPAVSASYPEKMEEEPSPSAAQARPYLGFEWQVKGIKLLFQEDQEKEQPVEVESKKVVKQITIQKGYYSSAEEEKLKKRDLGVQLESDGGELEFILDPVRDQKALQQQLDAIEKELDALFAVGGKGARTDYGEIEQKKKKGKVFAALQRKDLSKENVQGTTHATLDVKLSDVSELIEGEHLAGPELSGAQLKKKIQKKYKKLSGEVQGLITLIEYYLSNFRRDQTPDEQGPKAHLGLLVRNNFYAIYEKRLNEEQKEEFKGYVEEREGKEMPVFPSGYVVGEAYVSDKQSLTIKDWLQSIIEGDPGEDKYRHVVKEQDPERIRGRGAEYDALSPPPGYLFHGSASSFTYSMGRAPLEKDSPFLQIEKRNLSVGDDRNTFEDFREQALLVARLSDLPK